MEKIIVNPLEVRGLGNVVSPKTIEDFEVYNSSLSFEDDVYTLEYAPGTVSVSLSVDQSSITVGDGIILSAVVEEDGSPLENVSVRFVSGNQVLGTRDTDENGECILGVADLGVGEYVIYASALGQVSATVTVTVSDVSPSYDDIVVTSNKSILSYIDGDSATLSAQLMDGSSTASIDDVTVTFKVYKTSDDTLVDTLTADTNGSGLATVSYNSKGTGDIYIQADDSIISSETYSIEDCIYHSTTTFSSSTTMNISLPSRFKITFNATRKGSSNSSGILDVNGTRRAYVGVVTSAGATGLILLNPTVTYYTSYTAPLNTEITCEWECIDGANTFRCGGDSTTVSSFAPDIVSVFDGKSNCPLSNIKIKQL